MDPVVVVAAEPHGNPKPKRPWRDRSRWGAQGRNRGSRAVAGDSPAGLALHVLCYGKTAEAIEIGPTVLNYHYPNISLYALGPYVSGNTCMTSKKSCSRAFRNCGFLVLPMFFHENSR